MAQTITVTQTVTQAVGQRGPRGADGAAGAPGGVMTRIASTAIGGFKVVRELGDGSVALASSADAANAGRILGVTLGAASAGAEVSVIRQGEIVDGSMGLTPGPLFLGVDGAVVSAPPSSGVLAPIGVAATSGRAVIDVQQSILRG